MTRRLISSPPVNEQLERTIPLEVADLVDLVQAVMSHRLDFKVGLGTDDRENAAAISDILRVGTSAGGARPKAVIAMDKQGNVRSGQTTAPKGQDHWILKFDGVSDLELGEPKDYGRIDYAYHLMAKAAGIEMAECRLMEEHGRAHFLTRRFDRHGADKIHLQSLCGLAHYDFNLAGAYGYEQLFSVMRRLRLTKAEAIQQYRRMIFNVLARNQDDHTKNIAFLMDTNGRWALSPAFDVTYSHNPSGNWTSRHQMTINGKRDNLTLEDLLTVAESISLSRPKEIIEEVANAVEQWPEYARAAGLDNTKTGEIQKNHRFQLMRGGKRADWLLNGAHCG